MGYDWNTRGLSSQQMLEDSNTRTGALYKWVRVGEEFRFIRVIFYEAHKMLVNDDEIATDAGTIVVNNDFWHCMDRGSMTLKIGCSAEAETQLEQLLADAGREFRDRYSL